MKFAESQLISMHAVVYAVLTQPYTHARGVWPSYTKANEFSSCAYTMRGSFDLYGCCGTSMYTQELKLITYDYKSFTCVSFIVIN